MTLSLAACGGTEQTAAGNQSDAAKTSDGAKSKEIWYSTKNSTETVHVAMAKGVTDAAEMLGFSGKVTIA
ncbi:MAG TPA: hypothetical protein DD433_05225, partial [Ruminococcaceae bacterium]|nr:hypothetical protein [Oscillospiraceae bacterium]